MWRQAATQVFFALGLGFGSIIAYSSYNPKNNNCHRDAFTVSTINFLTSVLATLVVFAVLGFRAKEKVAECIVRYVLIRIKRLALHYDLNYKSLVYKYFFHNSSDYGMPPVHLCVCHGQLSNMTFFKEISFCINPMFKMIFFCLFLFLAI